MESARTLIYPLECHVKGTYVEEAFVIWTPVDHSNVVVDILLTLKDVSSWIRGRHLCHVAP